MDHSHKMYVVVAYHNLRLKQSENHLEPVRSKHKTKLKSAINILSSS